MTTQQSNRNGIRIDGDEAYISPSLREIVQFVGDIDRDVHYLVNMKENLQGLQDGMGSVFDDLQGALSQLGDLLETANIKAETTEILLKNIEDMNTKFSTLHKQHARAIRSTAICLFAYMETLASIVTVYNEEITDRNQVIQRAKDNLPSRISSYMLSDENQYFQQNQDKFKDIVAKDIISLRNSLAHFYSPSKLDKIVLVSTIDGKKDEILKSGMRKTKAYKNTTPLSPYDLLDLISGAARKLLLDRESDSIKDEKIFTRKIALVDEVIETLGTKMLMM